MLVLVYLPILLLGPKQTARIKNTGVPLPVLKQVGETIASLPVDFAPHTQIA
jgi:hypothetical protein